MLLQHKSGWCFTSIFSSISIELLQNTFTWSPNANNQVSNEGMDLELCKYLSSSPVLPLQTLWYANVCFPLFVVISLCYVQPLILFYAELWTASSTTDQFQKQGALNTGNFWISDQSLCLGKENCWDLSRGMQSSNRAWCQDPDYKGIAVAIKGMRIHTLHIL